VYSDLGILNPKEIAGMSHKSYAPEFFCLLTEIFLMAARGTIPPGEVMGSPDDPIMIEFISSKKVRLTNDKLESCIIDPSDIEIYQESKIAH
jgi:hypothetical protein